jgi:hypothetical protein
MQPTSRDLNPEEHEKLRNHVVNLRQGRFSSDGEFITTAQDIERIFTVELPRELAGARANNRKLHLLFYAHGGLVNEASGIAGALAQLDFWKANHIYPSAGCSTSSAAPRQSCSKASPGPAGCGSGAT